MNCDFRLSITGIVPDIFLRDYIRENHWRNTRIKLIKWRWFSYLSCTSSTNKVNNTKRRVFHLFEIVLWLERKNVPEKKRDLRGRKIHFNSIVNMLIIWKSSWKEWISLIRYLTWKERLLSNVTFEDQIENVSKYYEKVSQRIKFIWQLNIFLEISLICFIRMLSYRENLWHQSSFLKQYRLYVKKKWIKMILEKPSMKDAESISDQDFSHLNRFIFILVQFLSLRNLLK
jgi:hypothetical protein